MREDSVMEAMLGFLMRCVMTFLFWCASVAFCDTYRTSCPPMLLVSWVWTPVSVVPHIVRPERVSFNVVRNPGSARDASQRSNNPFDAFFSGRQDSVDANAILTPTPNALAAMACSQVNVRPDLLRGGRGFQALLRLEGGRDT